MARRAVLLHSGISVVMLGLHTGNVRARLIGTAPDKAGVLSFVLDGFNTEDVGKALDREGIAVRTGHHCAQPIVHHFGYESTIRASLAFYNTRKDVDALTDGLRRILSAASSSKQRSLGRPSMPSHGRAARPL